MKVTTKIPNQEELEGYVKRLKSLLAAAKANSEKAQQTAEKLREEIEREEETLDATNAKAVDQLDSKKRQLAALEKQAERESSAADAKYDELRQYLPAFRDIWGRAVQLEYKAAIDRIAESLTPFYDGRDWARQGAPTLPLAQAYGYEFAHRGEGDPSFNQIAIAERIIRQVEAFIGGESPFPETYTALKARRAALDQPKAA